MNKTKDATVSVNPRKLAKVSSKGPAALNIALDARRVLASLAAQRGLFLSLRETASTLGVSHHTLRDWEKRKLIVRVRSGTTGAHSKYRLADLVSLVELIRNKVKDCPSPLTRFGESQPYPFMVLNRSRFAWVRSEKALTPKEIAGRIGCHPSTIIRAIAAERLRGRRRTWKRWEIRRVEWVRSFPLTIENRKKSIINP